MLPRRRRSANIKKVDTINTYPLGPTAFIGYTERGGSRQKNGVVVRSITEFETQFETRGSIPHDHFILKRSLELYFVNGGREALVLSAGSYRSGLGQSRTRPIRRDHLESALIRLRKHEHTRVLVIPEMQILLASSYDRLLRKALEAVASLRMAFFVAEVRRNNNLMAEAARLRQSISGHTDLQRGALYAPSASTGGTAESVTGTIAAQFENTDVNRGVWKAPANVVISGFGGLDQSLTPSEVNDLVGSGTEPAVNALVNWGGPSKIWGARTMSPNFEDRYIPAVRYASWIRATIEYYLGRQRGQNNDALLWGRVDRSLEAFFQQQFRSGALQGPTSKKAYFISVGLGKTMTASDIQQGQMIVEIGMALFRPAEFRVLKFIQEL